MSGLYQEKQFKKWFLSVYKATLHKTQGLGLPDFYYTADNPEHGGFIEVKYRYHGGSYPIVSLLTKEQKKFFRCFRDITYLGYRTRFQGWAVYKLSKDGKYFMKVACAYY